MARIVRYPSPMYVAIPVWQGRVSPVLDVARRFLVVNVTDDRYERVGEISMGEKGITARVAQLTDANVDLIVCGAVSRALEALLVGEGIGVVSGVCGEIGRLLEALPSDRLNSPELVMPGCRCRRSGADVGQARRRRRCRGGPRGEEEV